MKKDKLNTNPTVDDRERRTLLSCSYCKPNRGENRKNFKKHGIYFDWLYDLCFMSNHANVSAQFSGSIFRDLCYLQLRLLGN